MNNIISEGLRLLYSDEELIQFNKVAPKRNLANCSDCGLCDFVFVPEEAHGSKVCFVAEAPGGKEAEVGRPLVGPSGKILNRCIEELGYKREDFDYQNSVLCRPTLNGTKNRTPTSEEIEACNARLLEETKNYKVLIALGRIAYLALTGREDLRVKDIANLASPTVGLNGVDVFGTYHPASMLYNRGRGNDNAVELSIRFAIKKAVRKLEEHV